MSNTNDEKVAMRGILLVTVCQIVVFLFFALINGWF